MTKIILKFKQEFKMIPIYYVEFSRSGLVGKPLDFLVHKIKRVGISIFSVILYPIFMHAMA